MFSPSVLLGCQNGWLAWLCHTPIHDLLLHYKTGLSKWNVMSSSHYILSNLTRNWINFLKIAKQYGPETKSTSSVFSRCTWNLFIYTMRDFTIIPNPHSTVSTNKYVTSKIGSSFCNKKEIIKHRKWFVGECWWLFKTYKINIKTVYYFSVNFASTNKSSIDTLYDPIVSSKHENLQVCL